MTLNTYFKHLYSYPVPARDSFITGKIQICNNCFVKFECKKLKKTCQGKRRCMYVGKLEYQILNEIIIFFTSIPPYLVYIFLISSVKSFTITCLLSMYMHIHSSEQMCSTSVFPPYLLICSLTDRVFKQKSMCNVY